MSKGEIFDGLGDLVKLPGLNAGPMPPTFPPPAPLAQYDACRNSVIDATERAVNKARDDEVFDGLGDLVTLPGLNAGPMPPPLPPTAHNIQIQRLRERYRKYGFDAELTEHEVAEQRRLMPPPPPRGGETAAAAGSNSNMDTSDGCGKKRVRKKKSKRKSKKKSKRKYKRKSKNKSKRKSKKK